MCTSPDSIFIVFCTKYLQSSHSPCREAVVSSMPCMPFMQPVPAASVQHKQLTGTRRFHLPNCQGHLLNRIYLQDPSYRAQSTTSALRCLTSLTTLTKLHLDMHIPHVPRALCSLSSLKTLTLRGAMRLRVPASITRLTRLTYLDFSSCGLRGLPRAICGITSVFFPQ